jgi:PAS domain S-box-containing protein
MNYDGRTKEQPFNKSSEIRQLLVQTEQFQNLASQVIELLNQTESRTDLIRDILFLIKAATGFEAVGIRLREGEDFPYYETIGFSKDFVKTERYLCARDQTGALLIDSRGNPYLECMCGNILSGKTKPALPFFTEGGSFWTNCTTLLLASTTEVDRQGRTRNRCNSEGYESVALIPIRYNNDIIGLLQLNDRRKNIFSLTLITFFESFVSSIGIALKNRQTESTILHFKEKLDTSYEASIPFPEEPSGCCKYFDNSPIGLLEEDLSNVNHCLDNLKKNGTADFKEYFTRHPEAVLSFTQKIKVLAVNKATLRMLKAKNKEELSQGWNTILNKDLFDVFREKFIGLAEGKTEFNPNPVNVMLDGEEMTLHLKFVVPPEHEEILSRMFVYIIDGTDIKRREEQLKESENKYRKIVEASHDAIILADMETGIVIDCNNKAEELLELTKHEIAGVHFSELHPSEVAEDYKMIFRSPMKEGITIPRTLFACRKCNKNIPVSVSSRVISLKGEKYISAIFRGLSTNDHEGSNCCLSPNEKPFYSGVLRHVNILSQREGEVLSLIAMGKTNRQIAEIFFISEKTVITHRARIMHKLDVHKTADLVRYAMTNGFLDEDLLNQQ